MSDHTHDLTLSSLFGNINITGNEGLYVDAMNITIDSNQDLFIRVSDEAFVSNMYYRTNYRTEKS